MAKKMKISKMLKIIMRENNVAKIIMAKRNNEISASSSKKTKWRETAAKHVQHQYGWRRRKAAKA
jgi:hypothetical protein